MRNINLAGLLVSAAFLVQGASAGEFSFTKSVPLKDIIGQSAEIDVPSAPSLESTDRDGSKDWTIMVFMNGKNNLAPYVLQDMNEMEMFGPTDNINIVTEAGRLKETPNPFPNMPDIYPWGGGAGGWNHPPPWENHPMPMMKKADSWTGVRRYEIVKDNDPGTINSILLETLPQADMGDYKHLVQFVEWARNRYPAKRYMLVVWNHGDGWTTKSIDRAPALRGISNDDETGHQISTVQLGLALKEMGGVDLYASDACLMQMTEVIYELKDHAPVIVGSEETEPGDGWAYNYFLERVHANKHRLTPEVMAISAVEGYNRYYAEKNQSTTQSAVKTAELGTFRELLNQWADLAMAGAEKETLKKARTDAKKYSGADSRDLTSFLTQVSSRTLVPELRGKSDELAAFIASGIVFKNATTGDYQKASAGLAIYLPSYGYSANYSKLAWAADSKWDEFVQWLNRK